MVDVNINSMVKHAYKTDQYQSSVLSNISIRLMNATMAAKVTIMIVSIKKASLMRFLKVVKYIKVGIAMRIVKHNPTAPNFPLV